jgi:hypothetical protein
MWELADTVPTNVIDFWAQRVVAAYEARQYATAFEAFRVIELAGVVRSREVGGPERFDDAIGWLLKRSFIKPRHHPTLPGELRSTAPRGHNRFSHHQSVAFPMVLSRAMCDETFGTFVGVLNEL